MEHLLLSSNEALNIVTARLMLLIHLSKLCHVARSFIKSFLKSSALVELLKNSIVSSERKKGIVRGSEDKETLGIQVSQGDSIRQDNNVEEHGIEFGFPRCPAVQLTLFSDLILNYSSETCSFLLFLFIQICPLE